MTKEKIIEILKTYGIIIDSNEIADELLILFKQELSERLEQLHTEMDERMREEVAIEKRMGEKKAEKQAREIICWFANETEKAFGKNYLAERIAKEFRVEL